MHHGRLSALALLGASAVLLTACPPTSGPDTPATTTSPSTTAAQPTTTTTTAPGPTTTLPPPRVEKPYFANSATGVDTGRCGPVVEPCRTINTAQDRAVADGMNTVRVAASSTAYAPFALRSGMKISGGWNSDFSALDGTSTVEGNPAVTAAGATGAEVVSITLRARSDVGHAVVSVSAKAEVALTDVDIAMNRMVADPTALAIADSTVLLTRSSVRAATGIGLSTYGVRATDGTQLTVVDSTITAGDAGPNVVAATPRGADGASGCAGAPGVDANPGNGCGQGSGAGGRGGVGVTSFVIDTQGLAGGWGAPGSAGGNGASGGDPARPNNWSDPTFGYDGHAGAVGASGTGAAAGANAPAGVAFDLWRSIPAPSGTPGGAGAGGGGGGAGAASWFLGTYFRGSGGGGGGGGGTAGAGGPGGYVGNGSFGVLAHDSSVTLIGSEVHAGAGSPGTPGGSGGNGGAGGPGGPGAPTAPGMVDNSGGDGGPGGAGGGGGGGAGGAGGPSVAVFHLGTGTVQHSGGRYTVALTAAPGGAAGVGGTAPGGPSAPAGAAGPRGLLVRIWSNGPILV